LNKWFKENTFPIKFWQNKLQNFQLTVKHINLKKDYGNDTLTAAATTKFPGLQMDINLNE